MIDNFNYELAFNFKNFLGGLGVGWLSNNIKTKLFFFWCNDDQYYSSENLEKSFFFQNKFLFNKRKIQKGLIFALFKNSTS